MKGKVLRCKCLEKAMKCMVIIDGFLICEVKKK